MKVFYELDLSTFKAWSGAVATLERIQRENKVGDLENLLEELYQDGLDETQLNDILWFEDEWLFENLGMRTEAQIYNEIEELKERIEELAEESADILEDLDDLEVEDDEELRERFEEIETEIEELKAEIEELEEEKSEL